MAKSETNPNGEIRNVPAMDDRAHLGSTARSERGLSSPQQRELEAKREDVAEARDIRGLLRTGKSALRLLSLTKLTVRFRCALECLFGFQDSFGIRNSLFGFREARNSNTRLR